MYIMSLYVLSNNVYLGCTCCIIRKVHHYFRIISIISVSFRLHLLHADCETQVVLLSAVLLGHLLRRLQLSARACKQYSLTTHL